MTEKLLKILDNAIWEIMDAMSPARNDRERGFNDSAVFDLETFVSEAREIVDGLMEDYRAEVEARPGFKLSHEMHAMYLDLDPYGAGAAKEYEETDEHFIYRCAAETCEDIPTLEDMLRELEEWTEDEPEYAGIIEGFRRDLEALKRASKTLEG